MSKTVEKPASVVCIARRKGELIIVAMFPTEGSFCEIDEACSTPREVKRRVELREVFGDIVDGFGMPDDDDLGDHACGSTLRSQIAKKCTYKNGPNLRSILKEVLGPKDQA